MNTINITSRGRSASFSTKALTMDGKEFLYTEITAIKHSSQKGLYLFRCGDAWHQVYYEPEDSKKVAAIFNRVAALNAKRAKAAAQNGEIPPEPAVQPEEPAIQEAPAVQPEEPDAQPEEQITQVEEPDAQPEEPADGVENAADQADEAEGQQDEVEGQQKAENTAETETETPDRKHRLRKGIVIFIIIIALFVAAGIAYFFILGPANDSSQSPNTDSTHQYDDIEDLIDEMQE